MRIACTFNRHRMNMSCSTCLISNLQSKGLMGTQACAVTVLHSGILHLSELSHTSVILNRTGLSLPLQWCYIWTCLQIFSGRKTHRRRLCRLFSKSIHTHVLCSTQHSVSLQPHTRSTMHLWAASNAPTYWSGTQSPRCRAGEGFLRTTGPRDLQKGKWGHEVRTIKDRGTA